MWTPRRILFLFAGLAAFLVVYVCYALFLGGVDGLPVLPEKYLQAGEGDFQPIHVSRQSPIETRIEQAFGAKCRELEDPAYRTKVEQRDKGLVFATGPLPEIKEPTKKILVSPLSLAVFMKQAADAGPGEVPEIVTIHSDQAYLEFDKPVTSRTEILNGSAKLVGVELIGNPDAEFQDVRKGLVYITHNQKSDDPNRRLIVRSPGPVFYTAIEPGKAAKSDVPTVRTSAKVEVENRANAPRPLWGQRFPAVVATGDDLRASNAISDIVLGRRAPPTTVTAIGLKMFFAQENEAPKPGQKAGSTQSKLREIQLTEAVQFNLWLEGASGFPGTNSSTPKKVVDKDPSMALAAVAGTLVGGKAVSEKLQETSLLTIETRGPFRFDVESNTAHFDIAATAPPNQSNNVEVVRISALGTRDTLISQKLAIAFEKSDGQPAAKPNAEANSALGGSGLRSVVATGPYVRLDSESDQMIAQGTSLHYESDRKLGKTTLNFKGSPIDAVKDRHRLKVGERGLVAELQYVSVPGKPGPKGQPTNDTTLIIRGPGGIAFYDQATKENSTTATWATSLTQTKEMVGDKNLDKYSFDSGRFNDAKAGFDLVGNILNLWVDSSPTGEAKGSGATTQAVPYRLQALQNVSLKSPELIIDETDALSVWFRQADPAAPKPPALAMTASPAIATGSAFPPPGDAANGVLPLNPAQPAGPTQPAPPPNPLRLTARTVDAWCIRTQAAATAAKPAQAKTAGGNAANEQPQAKYELERAICTDRVDAHQAPADPKKNPRGLDLRAAKLTLERQSLKDLVGFSLHLLANKGDFAELHYEDTSIAGPDITIDQLANYLRVIGAGALKMPANGGLTSVAVAPQQGVVRASATQPAIVSPAPAPAAPKSTSDMNVEWTESMEFKGADGVALFVGKVQARQDSTPILTNPPQTSEEPIWEKSYVLCHRLQIAFDRPIYFNQFNDKKPADPDGGPKVSRAICKPAPVDDAGTRPRTDGIVLFENEQRHRDRSIVKRERIRAPNLDFRAGEKGGGTLVCGGPGEVRILQFGSKEQQRPGQGGQVKPAPTNANEQEMKLTLVTYRTRLSMEDQGQAFQKAVFEGDVVAYHVPTTDFERLFEVYSPLPERSTQLKADETLTVSTYRPQTGKLEQKLDAFGNANFRTDEYHGRANRIVFDGRIMTLDGTGSRLALIEPAKPRIGDGVPMSARRIEYDTVDNRTKIVEGASGSLSPR